MTHEVWFAMLGLNLDLWSHSLVDKAVSEFGKLIVWEEDHDNMARVLVKARVISLDAIPWFFTFAEGDDPEADSWTVQCEVFHASLLGVVAQDEDMPPDDDDDVQPNHFDFYGFGQPGQGPPHQPAEEPDVGPNDVNPQGFGWNAWPNPENPPTEAQ